MQATDQGCQDLERSVNVIADVRVRRVKADDHQIVDSFVSEQEHLRQGHESELKRFYVEILV